jgi:hypothetical protein
VFTPLRSVTWADFLLADVLTSLAKPLSDTERAVCHLMSGPVMSPVEEVRAGLVLGVWAAYFGAACPGHERWALLGRQSVGLGGWGISLQQVWGAANS